MNEYILILIIIIFIYVFIFMSRKNMIYIEKENGESFYIRSTDGTNKKDKENLLSDIIKNLKILRDHLIKNIDEIKGYEEYIKQLEKNFDLDVTIITETDPEESGVTSYTVNKGEELSFCLTSKETKKLHDLNTMMYVAVHELSHVACPEIGHGPTFQKIFKHFLKESEKLNIYKKIDYHKNPVEYCGMTISSSVLTK